MGTYVRKKYDLAALVAEKMITDGVDLRAHRVGKYFGYTALMHAAGLCDVSVVKIVLPHSDAYATCRDGKTAAVLAREIGRNENAEYIEAFILSQAQQNTLGDEIPIPPPRPRKSIDSR